MDCSTEIWKPIAGYDNRYEVSSFGRVKRNDGKILFTAPNSRGYSSVKLQHNGGRKTLTVHRLVVEQFLPNPEALPQVNHIDGNKLNNRVDNLEWCIEKRSKPVEVTCISTGVTMRFDSANEAACVLGVHQGNLSAVCNGRIKSTGGYTARYIKSAKGDM